MTQTAAPRTQRERRESTRARLVEATVVTLAEHGYAATSIKRILEEAGVSVGGMYRHFPTLLDLVIAAAEEVRDRQFQDFLEGLGALGEISEEDCIELLRAACRKPINSAWYDLMVAARTHTELRERLQPFAETYYAKIFDLAKALPVAERWEPEAFRTAVFSVIHLLDGEAMASVVNDQPELEHLRTAQLAALLRGESLPGLRASTGATA